MSCLDKQRVRVVWAKVQALADEIDRDGSLGGWDIRQEVAVLTEELGL